MTWWEWPSLRLSKHSKFPFRTKVKNKQNHMAALLSSFHMNGHTLGFHLRTLKVRTWKRGWMWQLLFPEFLFIKCAGFNSMIMPCIIAKDCSKHVLKPSFLQANLCWSPAKSQHLTSEDGIKVPLQWPHPVPITQGRSPYQGSAQV